MSSSKDKPGAIMSNWNIKICSRLEWHFNYALEMAIAQHNTMSHYLIDQDGRRITLFWTEPPGLAVLPLPYKMDYQAVRDFVWNWLKTAPYDKKPDIDGSAVKGFVIETDYWGHALHWAGAVSISTEWALIGK